MEFTAALHAAEEERQPVPPDVASLGLVDLVIFLETQPAKYLPRGRWSVLYLYDLNLFVL